MKKRWFYILVAVGLSVLFVGCEEGIGHPGDNYDDSPTIDPPVNEFAIEDLNRKVFDKKLDAYEHEAKYIRNAQEQMELDTIQ